MLLFLSEEEKLDILLIEKKKSLSVHNCHKFPLDCTQKQELVKELFLIFIFVKFPDVKEETRLKFTQFLGHPEMLSAIKIIKPVSGI